MAEEKKKPQEKEAEFLVRIMGYDIPGTKKVYPGLTRIKGVSWTISKAVCSALKIPMDKKITELSKPEIVEIETFFKSLGNPSQGIQSIPSFLKNRRSDPVSGSESHIFGSDLDIKKEFDIKRLKKMRSYKGVRHSVGLPVRGQRTRSHFRSKGKTVGVRRKK